tara:strand:+ start:194 stop:1345 length:1152 start_codon:yes stop_codon:yes gene_type:complete
MSTLKVNSIKNTSTADGGIGIDGSGHVTVDDLQMPTAGASSNRNLIINGGMSVSQRTTSEAGITTDKYSACDRMQMHPVNLGTWTVSQETSGFSDTWETDATERFRTYFKALCTTPNASPGAAEQVFVLYTVESQDLKCLQYGTTQAKPAVFSFWVKSNRTGNASISTLQYQNLGRQLSAQYTINTPNTWEYKTIALPADPAGSFNYDNAGGLQIYFFLNSGSNNTGGSHSTSWRAYSAPGSNASNLGVGGTVSDYFAITGIQLELGSKATSFEHRSYGDELLRCSRYFVSANWQFCAKISGIGYRHKPPGPGVVQRTAADMSYFNPDTGTANQCREHSSGTAYTINSSANMLSNGAGATGLFQTSTTPTYDVSVKAHYDAEL